MARKVIYKYPVTQAVIQAGNTIFGIKLAKGAKIISVQVQNDRPAIYAEVNPHDDQDEQHEFYIATTGTSFDLPEGAEYLGTCMLNGGAYIVHIYHLPNS